MRRIRHLVEYFFVRLFLFLLDSLPLSFCARLAGGVADIVFRLHASRRRIAVENILSSGITSDRHDAERMARASFRHFARIVVESLKSDSYFKRHAWTERVDWQASPELQHVLDDPSRGLILACGHLGNWEIAAQLLSHRKPVVGITRAMNNPYVDRLMQARKPRNRFELTPKHDANMTRLVSALQDGKVLAIMIDQHARDRGMMIDFFGRPAATHTAIALLHLVTRTPICFGTCVETAPMRFLFQASGPLRFERTGDKQQDIRSILERLTRELETAIRAHPEQYMWGHRRWRDSSPASPAGARAAR